jgi:RNA polymerase primary sigma factor
MAFTQKSESLDRYFKSIQKLNPLKKEEELELARQYKNGCRAALDKLIEHNLKIVVTIANKNAGRGIPIDDLIQQGNLGLYEAALKFDPEQDVRFATFAGTRVLKSINTLIDNAGRIVRIPVNQEYQRYLDKKNGKEVNNISSIRMDDYIGDDEGSKTRESKIGAVAPDVDASYETDYVNRTVAALLHNLKERDRNILKMYYGIDQEEELPTKEIAEITGLTQIRVCQIISAATKKLQDLAN